MNNILFHICKLSSRASNASFTIYRVPSSWSLLSRPLLLVYGHVFRPQKNCHVIKSKSNVTFWRSFAGNIVRSIGSGRIFALALALTHLKARRAHVAYNFHLLQCIAFYFSLLSTLLSSATAAATHAPYPNTENRKRLRQSLELMYWWDLTCWRAAFVMGFLALNLTQRNATQQQHACILVHWVCLWPFLYK